MGNIISIAGEGSKKKKGSGFNAVLTLLKELSDFQDKVQVCIDAQDIAENRQRLEIFDDKLDEVAQVLLEMAEAGVRSKKRMDALHDDVTENPESEVLDQPMDDVLAESPKPVSVGKIQMINAPSIPKLPR